MRCPQCPIEPGIACAAETYANPRFCALVATHPGGAEAVRIQTHGRPEPTPDPLPAEPPPGPTQVIPVPRRCRSCGGNAAQPTILAMAKSATAAAVGFVASGFETASPDTQHQRLAICHGCDQYSRGQCRACGCMVDLKVRLPREACPLAKWTAE